jgi:hypothetical protein
MVLQLQEVRVFKDEVNLHVHLVQYICWPAYILEALQWGICSDSGGLAGTLKGKLCAGGLWLIKRRICIAIGLERMSCFNRPCDIVMGSICRWPARSMWVLSIAKIVGRIILTPTFFTSASYVFCNNGRYRDYPH